MLPKVKRRILIRRVIIILAIFILLDAGLKFIRMVPLSVQSQEKGYLEINPNLAKRFYPQLKHDEPEDAPSLCFKEERDSTTVRIVCVGDELTAGFPYIAHTIFPSQLQALLNRAAQDTTFEVINLGIPGFTSDILTSLLLEILQLEPQIVCLNPGSFEFAGNLISENEPVIYMSELGKFVMQYLVPDAKSVGPAYPYLVNLSHLFSLTQDSLIEAEEFIKKRNKVMQNFRKNWERVIRKFQEKNIRVVLSNLPVNDSKQLLNNISTTEPDLINEINLMLSDLAFQTKTPLVRLDSIITENDLINLCHNSLPLNKLYINAAGQHQWAVGVFNAIKQIENDKITFLPLTSVARDSILNENVLDLEIGRQALIEMSVRTMQAQDTLVLPVSQLEQTIIDWAKEVIAMPSYWPRAQMEMAHYWEARRDWQQAGRHYLAVAFSYPRDYAANYNLGYFCERNRLFLPAAMFLEKALKIRPEKFPLYKRIGNLYLISDKAEKSASYLEKALDYYHNRQVTYSRAELFEMNLALTEAYINLRKNDLARERLEFILTTNPEDYRVRRLKRYLDAL